MTDSLSLTAVDAIEEASEPMPGRVLRQHDPAPGIHVRVVAHRPVQEHELPGRPHLLMLHAGLEGRSRVTARYRGQTYEVENAAETVVLTAPREVPAVWSWGHITTAHISVDAVMFCERYFSLYRRFPDLSAVDMKIARSPLLFQLCRSLAQRTFTESSPDRLWIDRALDLVALEIGALFGTDAPIPSFRIAPAALRRVLARMSSDLAAPLRVDDLADVAGLSRAHFSRMFLASTGMSPYRWRLARRIEEAKRLLSGSSASLEEVARATGFGRQAHFSTTFKQHTGLAPTEWRRVHGR